jgi:thioredoxin-like negative regulator of GroEL
MNPMPRYLSHALSLSIALLLPYPARAEAPVVIAAPGLVEFEAASCGPCQRIKPVVARLEQAGARVTHIDVDRARGAAAAYRVTQTPTFLALDRNGREVGRVVGATSEQQLRALAQRITK